MTSASRPELRHASDALVLGLVCVAQFMVVLDVSVVNVALPSIGRSLHYTPTGLQWVVNAYVLTFAGFLLLGGRLADLLGQRRVFIGGLVLFSLASLAGGFAHTATELTAARAVQGLGGAVLSPATLTVIMTTFTDGLRRNRALGAWSAVAGAGGAMGVIAGGLLTSYLSWRWVLFVNVPIGIAAVVAARLLLAERRGSTTRRDVDMIGSLTATAGLALLVYGIVGTDVHPWGSARTLALIGAGLALLAGFVYLQARVVRAPLMPLGLFRSRALSVANAVMLLAGAAFFSMWYFLSLYLQQVQGYGPLKAGLLFLPMSAAIIACAQLSSRLIGRVGVRPVLAVGLAAAAGGFWWLGGLTATSSYTSGVLGGAVLIAGGMGLSFAPLAAAATAGVPVQLAGLASGVLNTARQVGGSLGLAALATAATDRTRHLIGTGAHQLPAVTAGYDRAFLAAGFACLAAAGIALALPSVGRHAREHAPQDLATPAPALVD